VLVLRKDQRVRERAEVAAHIAKGRMGHLFARYPQIHGGGLASTVNGLVSQTNLVVEFQRACLDGQRARRRTRFRRFVEDPYAHFHTREPQG
jgi:hypothetical protein